MVGRHLRPMPGVWSHSMRQLHRGEGVEKFPPIIGKSKANLFVVMTGIFLGYWSERSWYYLINRCAFELGELRARMNVHYREGHVRKIIIRARLSQD